MQKGLNARCLRKIDFEVKRARGSKKKGSAGRGKLGK